jgi:hypothetical protein
MNKMKKIFALIFTTSLLQGCLTNSYNLADDAIFLKTAPVCDSEELCARMWEEAGNWVRKYSPQGIDVYSDTMIRSVEKDLGSFNLEIEVKKVAEAEGRFKIMIDVLCNTALASCNTERKNMLAFNKKLTSLLPAEQREVAQKTFNANAEVEDWLKLYGEALNKNDLDAMQALYHFPVTIVEANKVTVLQNAGDLQQYQREQSTKLANRGSTYLKLGSHKIVDKARRTAYVTTVLTAYNSDNVRVTARQMSLQLLSTEGLWQLMSLVFTD